MMGRVTRAFREKDRQAILKNSAEIGHYIADAHVPLHVSRNHNGQLTHQEGIHAFWESRIPELFAEADWDYFIGRAEYITDLPEFIGPVCWTAPPPPTPFCAMKRKSANNSDRISNLLSKNVKANSSGNIPMPMQPCITTDSII